MTEALAAKMAYVHQAKGIADILDLRTRTQGPREAVVCGDERVSYNELKHRARVVTRHLRQLGVLAGDKVGFYMPNSIDFVASFFGTTALDCVVVPINPLLKADEIAHIMSDSQAKALIVHEELVPSVVSALDQMPSLEAVLVVRDQESGTPPAVPKHLRTLLLDRELSPDTMPWPSVISSDKEPALIIYTSGTTGKPKGAVLSHYNLVTSFPGKLDMFEVDENDRLLGALPMCHIFGISVVILGTIGRGATLVILPKFEAVAALETIERERITLMPAVPAMFQMMLYQLTQTEHDLSTMRFCWSGGAPLPVDLIDKVQQKFGAPLIEGYGLTETACVSTINPLHGARKPGSVGPAMPGIEVECFGPSGNILPPGKDNVGEIAVRGSNIMLGYYNQPEATAQVLKDGWFFTGDLGYKDEDGYFFIVGRKKELIIRGGANVYPKEVEDVIAKIAGVREVAVIGVPDEFMGERVKAVVVCGNAAVTEDTVKEHCQKHLADYKVPRIVEFVPALPRNSTGKVLKRLLT